MSKPRKIKRSDLPAFAVEILQQVESIKVNEARVVALKGDLGAGKTTLVQAIGAALGVTEAITSPTFTIMKQYDTLHPVFKTLVHIDAYRIDDESELRPLRFTELLQNPELLLCIEWPEKIAHAMPTSGLQIELILVDEETRTVQVSPL